jgi:hypothetical protein
MFMELSMFKAMSMAKNVEPLERGYWHRYFEEGDILT